MSSDDETGYASPAASDDGEEIFSDVPEWLDELAERAGVPAGAPLELAELYPDMKGEIFSHLRRIGDLQSLAKVNKEFRALLSAGMQRQWRDGAVAYVGNLATSAWNIQLTPALKKKYAVLEKTCKHLTDLTQSLGWLRCLRMNFGQRPRIEPARIMPNLWDSQRDKVLAVLLPASSVYVMTPKRLYDRSRWTYTPRDLPRRAIRTTHSPMSHAPWCSAKTTRAARTTPST
jgi:hypothetical protein